MTGEEARQLLTSRFLSEWGVAFPTMDIFIEGVSEPDLTQQKTTFVMFKVELPSTQQADLSVSPLKRYMGVVAVNLFVPMGSGTKDFFMMTDTVVAALAIQTIGSIRMYSTTTIERQPAVGWQSREVLVNYSFDSSN